MPGPSATPRASATLNAATDVPGVSAMPPTFPGGAPLRLAELELTGPAPAGSSPAHAPFDPPTLVPGGSDADADADAGAALLPSPAPPFVVTLDALDPDGMPLDGPLDVFALLPEPALDELARGAALRRFAAGAVIVREGDPGDACFVIADGEVRVLKEDPLSTASHPVEVARLGTRALFGEFALLGDRRRHATVEATSDVEAYVIPRALLAGLARRHADVRPALERIYRQRLLATLLRCAPLFAPVPESQRAELLGRFAPRRAAPGEVLLAEGQSAGGLFLILLGSVTITRRQPSGTTHRLATLREGAYFGEMSLLTGDTAAATATADDAVELAVLAPEAFYDVVASHPAVWSSLQRQAQARAAANARLFAGDTGAA
jgi:CRP-like cAMP-binding protein